MRKSTINRHAEPAPEPLDPIVEEVIQQAMLPYLGVLPPSGLESMRYALVDALTTHPDAIDALRAMREQPAADGSGTRVRDGNGGGETGGEGGAA
jgi:hypothetical protein